MSAPPAFAQQPAAQQQQQQQYAPQPQQQPQRVQQVQNGAPRPAPSPAVAPSPAATTAGSAAASTPSASATNGRTTLPAYDLYLDLPHPAASAQCPPKMVVVPPQGGDNGGGGSVNSEEDGKIAAELSGDNTVARIARFAFPEFDDQVHASEVAKKPPQPPNSGSGLNRYDCYLLTPGTPASSHHTFAMQLSTGARVYGHVRRYLPHNINAKARYDVGRRGIRAMVILTRGSGGERFYAAMLKTVEAISSQELVTPDKLKPRSNPQQTFLHGVYHNHKALCAKYAAAQDEMANKPNVITMSGLEFGNKQYTLPVDTFKLLVPTALLHAHSETDALSTTSSQLLPLLRCVGVSNCLRLLSALLCERRVVLTSRSPARLTGCARGALSMLAQGMLSWQHVYVPMLPPGMMTYLAAPMPYLVGVLASHTPLINRIPGIGEVLIFNLDTNEMDVLNSSNPQLFVPDLLRTAIQQDYGQPYGQPYISLAEILGQDLAECIKADKGSGYGPSNVQDKVGAAASIAAGKANTLFKGAMKKLKKQSSKISESQRSFGTDSQRSTSNPSMGDVVEQAMDKHGMLSREGSMHGMDGLQQQNGGGPAVPPETNYTFGEGYENEASEEEARIAFTSFFLCFLGDMRWYLTQPGPGQPPVLDKEKFIGERRRAGDAEGTPMYPLLSTFVQTQIFEQFATARVEEVRARKPVQKDAPLFLLASNYHRVKRMDFSHLDVRRVVRQVAQTENPSQYLIDWDVAIRRKAMALTSNSRNEAAVPQVLAQISEECNECGYILVDVMAVIWERIRDSRSTQWKHGLFALQLLRELLLHGPITAVTEAEDGIDKIRELKSYDFAMREQNSAQIRTMAAHVYDMIVDRAKLFNQRRTAACTRRRQQLPRPRPAPRDSRLRLNLPFRNIHDLVRPNFIPGSARVAPAPPTPARGGAAGVGGPPMVAAPTMDLLNKSPAPTPAPSRQPSQQAITVQAATNAYASDLLGMTGGPAPTPAPQQQQQQPQQVQADPFAPKSSINELADIFSATSVAPTPAAVAQPTSTQATAPAPTTQPNYNGSGAPTGPTSTMAPIVAAPSSGYSIQPKPQPQQHAGTPSRPGVQPSYAPSPNQPGGTPQQQQPPPTMPGQTMVPTGQVKSAYQLAPNAQAQYSQQHVTQQRQAAPPQYAPNYGNAVPHQAPAPQPGMYQQNRHQQQVYPQQQQAMQQHGQQQYQQQGQYPGAHATQGGGNMHGTSQTPANKQPSFSQFDPMAR